LIRTTVIPISHLSILNLMRPKVKLTAVLGTFLRVIYAEFIFDQKTVKMTWSILSVCVKVTVSNLSSTVMMLLVGNTHARIIILLALMSMLLQIILSFRMLHGSNRKNSYYSRMYLNGDFDGLQIQTAYDSRVVHNASTASIDYSSLAVDDPLFADMPWPTESGTAESKAFANHIQWKRKLSDGES